MTEYKLEKKLSQQTPVIHFQYDHQGATLRASEVKPKLDRFLIARWTGEDKMPDEWFIDRSQSNALNYKMRFYQNSSANEKNDTAPHKICYANTGEGKENEKDLVRYVFGNCTMTIICFKPKGKDNQSSLMDYIKENLKSFFAVTNFGMMQNKGFGSYSILKDKNETEDICSELAAKFHSQNIYYFECLANNKQDKRKDYIFDNIENLYNSVNKSFKKICPAYKELNKSENRIPSPVFFKVIDDTVYFTANLINGSEPYGFDVEKQLRAWTNGKDAKKYRIKQYTGR